MGRQVASEHIAAGRHSLHEGKAKTLEMARETHKPCSTKHGEQYIAVNQTVPVDSTLDAHLSRHASKFRHQGLWSGSHDIEFP